LQMPPLPGSDPAPAPAATAAAAAAATAEPLISGEIKELCDVLDCEVGIICNKIEDLTGLMCGLKARIETLEIKMSNVLRQLGSFWAEGCFPIGRAGVLPGLEKEKPDA